MTIKNLDNLYFDQGNEGSDSQMYFDTGWNFDDSGNNANIIAIDSGDAEYVYVENVTDSMRLSIIGNEEGTDPIDLMALLPRKFKSSELLEDFLKECGLMAGEWKLLISEMYKLLNPSLVNYQYLRKLGENIGIVWPPYANVTNDEARKTIQQQVSWYKIKGTYQSLLTKVIAKSWTVNIYDMYTNDYSTFVRTAWKICEENQNPTGLDSSYYKSPHIGIDVELNTKYTDISGYHLWRNAYTEYLLFNTDRLRPVHTVPHFAILLRLKTDMSNVMYETDGEIKTITSGNWHIDAYYFDNEALGSELAWNFDEGVDFDSSQSAFLDSITNWKLYNGNYNQSPNDSGFTLTDEIASGTGITYIEYSDRIEFSIVVSKATTFTGCNALALIIPGTPDEIVLTSCFPNIDKNNEIELRITISVYKNNL